MLSDYIPVYWPETNSWSFPSYELREYIDLCPAPQDIKLHNGAVVRGIPLIHFGTWGAVCVNVTELINSIAKDPCICDKLYRSKNVAAATTVFFKMLVMQYPGLAKARMFKGRSKDSRSLNVPVKCIRQLGETNG